MSWFDDADVPKNLKAQARELYDFFEKRRTYIVHVKCFYNFRKEGDSYRGLCVQLHPTYELTPADRVWLSEDHHRSTTVAFANVSEESFSEHKDRIRESVWDVKTLPGDHDFGVYMERIASDYSSEDERTYMCITTNRAEELMDVPLEGSVDTWVARCRQLISAADLKERNMGRINDLFPKATCTWHKETNMFIRDNTTWRYVNYVHNIQPGDENVFIRIHPSVGYERFNLEPREGPIACPADMGYGMETTALEDMAASRKKHMDLTHWWDSTQVVHARAQRDPAAWTVEFPMRKMRVFNPNSLRVIALKLGEDARGLTLEEGWALSRKSKVQYKFHTVKPTVKSLRHLYRPEYVHGDGFALTKEECDKMGIQ